MVNPTDQPRRMTRAVRRDLWTFVYERDGAGQATLDARRLADQRHLTAEECTPARIKALAVEVISNLHAYANREGYVLDIEDEPEVEIMLHVSAKAWPDLPGVTTDPEV